MHLLSPVDTRPAQAHNRSGGLLLLGRVETRRRTLMAFYIDCMGCDARLRADTQEMLHEIIAAHGKDVHNMDLASMPENQKQQMMSRIKEE